ncbi:MAG: PPK2 family polyphosphate kinase [Bacteroidota bacterium]
MINLDSIPTRAEEGIEKGQVKREIKAIKERIQIKQKLLSASAKNSLLVILQGMDASGKDGTVRGVFSGIFPGGISVYSFKKPTDLEFSHDYLWRVHKQVPKMGMIKVFNRSHYEDILVPSVYGYIPKDKIEQRYTQINQFEEHLEANGTKILKFYLHVSKDEQYKRLMERIEMPHKNWKHNDGDWETRDRWDDFMKVYHSIFEKCNAIPWNIIPSDQNWHKIYLIAKKVEEALNNMDMEYPELETERFSK